MAESAFIFFGAVLSWIIAIGQLARPQYWKSWITFFWFGVIGYWQFYFALLFSTTLLEYPHLYQSHAPAFFFGGPLTYLYFKAIHDPEFKPTKRDLIHFIPVIIVFVYQFPVYARPVEDKVAGMMIYYNDRILEFPGVAYAASAHIFCYLAYLIRKYFKISLGQNPLRSLTFYLSCLLVFWVIVDALSMVSLMLESRTGAIITNTLISLTIVMMYMLGQVFPSLLSKVELAVVNETANRYQKSRLKGVDLGDLQSSLHGLMAEEKYYQNENITLKVLAEELEVTPHQLSEFLNDHLNQNLNSYVNGFRIEEAKALLISEPDMTTLTIGLRVGFNSSSSFHATFRRFTGASPGQFRKTGGDC